MPFKVQEAERIDQENLRIMYKIVNVEPILNKKKLDQQYRDYKKLRKQISKIPEFDLDKLKENRQRIFQQVEQKQQFMNHQSGTSSHFLPKIMSHKRSKSTLIQSRSPEAQAQAMLNQSQLLT